LRFEIDDPLTIGNPAIDGWTLIEPSISNRAIHNSRWIINLKFQIINTKIQSPPDAGSAL